MSVLQEKLKNLTQLIQHVSGLQAESAEFQHLEKVVLSKIQYVDTSFRPNRKEIDRVIQSLSDKFRFHGFLRQANNLQRIYNKLAPERGEDQDQHRLSVVKLLIALSESPTKNFYKLIEGSEEKLEEEVIDWPKYLQEGVVRWTPPLDNDSSESDSDLVVEKDLEHEVDGRSTVDYVKLPFSKPETIFSLTYQESKSKLETTVQSHWFSQQNFVCKPPSEDPVANVTFLWDEFVADITKGLIPYEGSTVISEYKVLREVIWQFYKPHQSACFEFIGNKLVPRCNVTISSVRTQACESFLQEFVVYIEWLQELREFSELILSECNNQIPDTYQSYQIGLEMILNPVFTFLRELEDRIKAQESTFTLLCLANELRPSFQLVKSLLDIHHNVIINSENHSQMTCATMLLSRLYQGLLLSSSKLEQDIYLTLYLHSLYKYFTIINKWLESDILNDRKNEFVIVDKIQQDEQDWHLQFVVKDLDETAKSDPIINLICTHILEFGRNFHLLRLLQQRNLYNEHFEPYKDNLYDAFKQRILEKIAFYFKSEIKVDACDSEIIEESDLPNFIFPVGCPDECKYPTEMDKLENLVDTSDGFLIKAFESYFVKKPKEVKVVQQSLYERIQSLTKGLFPTQNIVPHAFIEILDERYSKLGIMVKNALFEDCELEKHFLFLQSVFLFKDDITFSFYHKFLNFLDSNQSWSIQISLTSHLQDTIADAYPKLYDKASVDLKENWQLNLDPVIVCQKINIQYRIEWPINIIIRTEHIKMYKYLFQFILKIKWALYTLNHLYFNELQPKKPKEATSKSMKRLIRKLEILRFGLVNIFSNIQHYMLGHMFSELSVKFKNSFESSFGLENVIKAHTNFVYNFYKASHDFQEYEKNGYGFCLLLHLVKKLKTMWGNIRKIKNNELDVCEKAYWMCHLKIEPIINPTGLCL